MLIYFLCTLHKFRTRLIISLGKVTIQLKVCLFVMILQRLLWLRWDGLVAYTISGYGCIDVYLSKEIYFSNMEYLLGDLAFSASMVMVPAFKKGANDTLSEE